MNDRYRLLLFLASAGNAAVCFTVTSCVETDHFPEIFDTVCGDGVMHPFSLFVVINKATVCKNFHVMRKSRLRDIQFLQQIASTLFSMLECPFTVFTIIIFFFFFKSTGTSSPTFCLELKFSVEVWLYGFVLIIETKGFHNKYTHICIFY